MDTICNVWTSSFIVLYFISKLSIFRKIKYQAKRAGKPTKISLNLRPIAIENEIIPENPTNLEIEPLNNAQVKLSWTKTSFQATQNFLRR